MILGQHEPVKVMAEPVMKIVIVGPLNFI